MQSVFITHSRSGLYRMRLFVFVYLLTLKITIMIKKALLLTTLAGLMLTGCKDFDCCMSSVIIVTPTSVTLEPANGNLADVYVASNLPWAVTAKPD